MKWRSAASTPSRSAAATARRRGPRHRVCAQPLSPPAPARRIARRRANVTARDIGVQARQGRALRALIDCAARGSNDLTVIERPVMRVDPAPDGSRLRDVVRRGRNHQGIEYCKRKVRTLGLRGEIRPAVTMARFVIAMARGERAMVAQCRSPWRSMADPLPRSTARSCASPRSSDWSWDCVPTRRRSGSASLCQCARGAAPLGKGAAGSAPWPAQPLHHAGERLRKPQRTTARHRGRQPLFRRWRNLCSVGRQCAGVHRLRAAAFIKLG